VISTDATYANFFEMAVDATDAPKSSTDQSRFG
jgi:hypothetical protein